MNVNPEWNDALETWVAEERERLGGPPSPEDVDAFLRGALPDAEAARVRTLLVYYPELTALLDQAPRPARRSRFLPFAIAAALALALSIPLALQIREQREPVLVLQNLQVRGRPSAQTFSLPARDERYSLELVLAEPHDGTYRVAIADSRSRIVWSEDGLHPPLRIEVPRRMLPAGSYRIVVFSNRQPAETFWIRTH